MKIKFIIKEQSLLYFTKWEDILVNVFDKATADRIPYDELTKLGLKYLGNGAFRTVYSFPDNEDIVLKVCQNIEDADMNEVEANPRMQTKYALIVPKTFIRADDYRWIVMERVRPIPDLWELNRILPDFKLFLNSVREYADEDTVIDSVKKVMQKMGVKRISPTLNALIDFCIEYNVAISELREKNMGITKDGRVVVLDASVLGPWQHAKHEI